MADAERFEVHAFNPQGDTLASFGGEDLRQGMVSLKAAKRHFQTITDLTLFVLIGLVLGVLGVIEMAKRKGLI